jgi:hypothetical protein
MKYEKNVINGIESAKPLEIQYKKSIIYFQ